MYYVGVVAGGSVTLPLGRQDSHIQIEITQGEAEIFTTMPPTGGATPAPFSHGTVTDEMIVLDVYGVESITITAATTAAYNVISYLSD